MGVGSWGCLLMARWVDLLLVNRLESVVVLGRQASNYLLLSSSSSSAQGPRIPLHHLSCFLVNFAHCYHWCFFQQSSFVFELSLTSVSYSGKAFLNHIARGNPIAHPPRSLVLNLVSGGKLLVEHECRPQLPFIRYPKHWTASLFPPIEPLIPEDLLFTQKWRTR